MRRSLRLSVGLTILLLGSAAWAVGETGEIVFDFARKPKYGFFEKAVDYRGGRVVDRISFAVN